MSKPTATLVDSCILIDLLANDARWADWSLDQLARLGSQGVLVINPIILAEVSPRFERAADLEAALADLPLVREALPWDAAFLAGQAFKPLAARLDGVDLSPAMIEKARARRIYDDLAVADLESALAAPGPAYDLILAADTLVYLGDLRAVFEGARKRLGPDGYFLFTTEAASGNGFELGPKRRWRHSDAYLRATAEAAGLSVAGLVAAAPRHEANQPVDGFAVALTPE